MPDFKFDPDKHIYTLDGRAIPSVTQVLPYNYSYHSEYARQRGIYVHTMIELYNQDNLNEESLDKELQPFLNAYKKFRNDYK